MGNKVKEAVPFDDERATRQTRFMQEFNYSTGNLGTYLSSIPISKQLKKRMEDYNIVAGRSCSFTVRGSNDSLMESLENLGEVYNYGSSSCFVFMNDRPLRVRISSKNDLSEIEIFTYFSSEEAESGLADKKQEVKREIYQKLSNIIIEGSVMTIKWYHWNGKHSYTDTMTEILDDTVYQSAYPDVELDKYIDRYLESKESVLLLRGKPGTGKTRLIRYMLQRMNDKKDHDIKASFTNQSSIVKKGDIFREFITEGKDVMILEDIDESLSDRESGNKAMATILNAADGVIRSGKNGKIIMTTNLPNIDHLDQALIRPGRCFDVLALRELSANEGEILSDKLGSDHELDESKKYTLAELYELANEGCTRERVDNLGIGFSRE